MINVVLIKGCEYRKAFHHLTEGQSRLFFETSHRAKSEITTGTTTQILASANSVDEIAAGAYG